MLKYIALPLIFIVSFFLIQIGIQVGLGMYMTKKYVPNIINAYESTNVESHQSKVEFGSYPSGITPQKIIVWLVSLGISTAIVFLIYRYGFQNLRTAT
ncbi:MAG: hypothetical protein K0Q73_5761 [Paenibacillus sp.]|jgi:hypothetical protein|nr:hypothetical protein [Paenibacillus sp.]